MLTHIIVYKFQNTTTSLYELGYKIIMERH